MYNHSMLKEYTCAIKMECFYKLLLKEEKFLDPLHAMEIYVKGQDDKVSYSTSCFDPNIDEKMYQF